MQKPKEIIVDTLLEGAYKYDIRTWIRYDLDENKNNEFHTQMVAFNWRNEFLTDIKKNLQKAIANNGEIVVVY